MANAFLSRSLLLILFAMPFMAPIWLTENHFYANNTNLKMTWGVITSFALLSLLFLYGLKEKKLMIRQTSLYLPMFGFLFWCFVSLIWVENIFLAVITLIQYTSYVLVFFLTVNLFFTSKDFYKVFNVILLSMVLVSIVGLLQYYFLDNFVIQNLFYQKSPPSASFVNKNMASHFIVMTLPIGAVFLLTTKNKFNAILYSLAIFIGFWFMLYINARQAYVATIVEVLLLLVFLVLDRWKNIDESFVANLQLSKLKKILLSVIILSLIVIANFTNKGWAVDQDNSKFNSLLSINVEGGKSRIPLWVNTIEMIKDYPIRGVGVAQWSEHYPLYYDKAEKDVAFNENTRLKRVHNEYIEMLASVGIIGYSFLFWLSPKYIILSWV